MTTDQTPAVSEAMREAVLELLYKHLVAGDGPAVYYQEEATDAICILYASEIARLTRERDAAQSQVLAWHRSFDDHVYVKSDFYGEVWGRLRAAEAETARLRAALADVEGKCELARSVYATEETATPSRAAEAFAIVRNVARAALSSQEKTDG